MIGLYRRFSALEKPERRGVLEATALTLVVWSGLRLFRYSALRRGLRAYAHTTRHRTSHAASRFRVLRAVNRVAGRLPAANNCLVLALVADTMLQRRGQASEIRIGVRRSASRRVQAHAWVECDGAVVVGALDDLAEYAPLVG
jgi:hypothetical protein